MKGLKRWWWGSVHTDSKHGAHSRPGWHMKGDVLRWWDGSAWTDRTREPVWRQRVDAHGCPAKRPPNWGARACAGIAGIFLLLATGNAGFLNEVFGGQDCVKFLMVDGTTRTVCE